MFHILDLRRDLPPNPDEVMSLFSEAGQEQLREAVDRCQLTGEPWDLILPLRTHAGRSLWVRSMGEFDRHRGGAGRLHGILQDVTERKRLERAIEANERTLSRLHEITSDARLDLHSKIQQLIRLGVEALGLHFGFLSEVQQDDVHAHTYPADLPIPRGVHGPLSETLCSEAMRSQQTLALHDVERSSPSGLGLGQSLQLGACISTPLQVDGVTLGALCFGSANARDPFEHREIELVKLLALWIGVEIGRERSHRALQVANEAAEVAASAKDRFLATMSHEIRTPMNGVMGMTQLLLETELSQEHRDMVETLRSSGAVLTTLLNDILDVSKISAGKMMLEQETFDLRRCATEVVELFAAQAQTKNITLCVDIGRSVPQHVVGDSTRLRQIVSNFLSNATKFTESGSITLTLRVDGGLPERVRFSVKDSGIGIDAEKHGHLFQAFCQADSSTTRKYGGTGLGLMICKELAELMGGEVGFASQPGEGSTFWVVVPLPAVCPVPPVAPTYSMRVTLVPGVRKRVLLAEDNAINVKVALRMLAKLGHEVEVADNGRVAVEKCQTGAYDLVLMDCQMPEMDGLTATRHIRELESADGRPRMTIFALTASASAADRHACLEAGMDGYLSKPVELRALEGALSAAPGTGAVRHPPSRSDQSLG